MNAARDDPRREDQTGEQMPPPGDQRRHIFDHPKNVRRALYILFGLCGLLLLGDVLFLFQQKHLSFGKDLFPVEGYFGFYSLFGFCACVILVLIAGQMRKVLMRKEDYYER